LKSYDSDVNLSGLTAGGKLEPKESGDEKFRPLFLEVMMRPWKIAFGAEDGLFGGSSSSEIYRGMLREQLRRDFNTDEEPAGGRAG